MSRVLNVGGAVRAMCRFGNAKAPMPELTTMQFSQRAGALTVRATDLALRAWASVPNEGCADFDAFVELEECRYLSARAATVRHVPGAVGADAPGYLEFGWGDDGGEIRQRLPCWSGTGGSAKLTCVPDTTGSVAQPYTREWFGHLRAVARISHGASSRYESRPLLESVYQNEEMLAATDGYRLVTTSAASGMPLLIPWQLVRAASRHLGNGDGVLTATPSHVILSSPDGSLGVAVETVYGQFPPVARIMRQQYTSEWQGPTATLRDVMATIVHSVARGQYARCTVHMGSSGVLDISDAGRQITAMVWGSTEIESGIAASDFDVDARYVLDALLLAGNEAAVTWRCGGAASASTIITSQYSSVIMPLYREE